MCFGGFEQLGIVVLEGLDELSFEQCAEVPERRSFGVVARSRVRVFVAVEPFEENECLGAGEGDVCGCCRVDGHVCRF